MQKTFILWAVIIVPLLGDNWPRFLGEGSSSLWKEEGIRKDLPESGAEILWRVKSDWGYSGPSVVDGKVYLPEFKRSTGDLMNNPGKAVDWKGVERLRCLDLKTGMQLWSHDRELTYTLSYPGGPRSVPTVADGRVFFLGAMGNLSCLDAKSGSLIWESDFQKDFGAPLPIWGFSAHPLVVGDTLYCLVGGDGSIAVAFDAASGKVKWKSLSGDKQGYCPPVLIEAGGKKQLVIWQPDALNGLNPETGDSYWSVPLKPRHNMSVTIPRVSGNRLFASGIGRVGAMVELGSNEPTAKILWRGKPKTAIYSCNSTPILLGDVLYGTDIDTSNLIAMDWATGERIWETNEPVFSKEGAQGARHGTAYLTYHEANKQFWIANEAGELVLTELSKEGYKELGRQTILKPTNEAFGRDVVWSPPAFSGKSILMRNDKELVRVDLSE